MQIKRVQLEGFMTHASTTVELPDHGIVLVTGPNGSGKSSLVEAVAVAFWGKTLRGTDPWTGNGSVSVIAPSLEAHRVAKGKKKTLTWCHTDSHEETTYATPTKAQQALEAVIGQFDAWRRTHVFSSQDAAHFTLATDAERKRLIEALMGLDRFDPALAACRADRKAKAAEYATATRLLEQLESQYGSAQERLADAQKVLGTIPEPVEDGAAVTRRNKLKQLIRSTDQDLRDANLRVRELGNAGADAAAEARQAQRRLDQLGDGDCDNCGQPIPAALIEKLKIQVRTAEKSAEEAGAAAAREVSELTAVLDDLREEKEDLIADLSTLTAGMSAAEATRRQRLAAQEAVDKAEQDLDGLNAKIREEQAAAGALEQEVKILTAAEQVLGLKGVRAHVLGKTLGGLEAVANVWLSRICGTQEPYAVDDANEAEVALGARQLALRLKPYSEKKGGGTSDAISLEVVGAGGGHGYKGSSGGERRRIDVALLLALAEVAQAAVGGDGRGVLWADEVFDALDADGISQVVGVLAEMAEERCVVVISHSPELQRALCPDIHFRVDAGRIAGVL